MLADWIEQDANCGDVREIATPNDAQANAARRHKLALQVFGRWAQLVAQTFVSV